MDIFDALSDPTRRGIIELLARSGVLAASDIYAHFPASPPAISQHLKVLREANLVLMEKRAQQRMYRLNPVAMAEVEAWARTLGQRWNERFNALDVVLQEEKAKLEQPDGSTFP